MKRFLLIAAFCIVVIAASCIRIQPQDSEAASKSEPSAAEPAAEESAAEESIPYDGLVFTTTDRAGQTWDQSVFVENTLTMINFWEPWCGPCVREMPDLAKLAEDYQDKGLMILGVYSTTDMEKDVDTILEQTKVTYPILRYAKVFEQFQTGYVPTTVFVDAQGKVLGELYVGSRSYKDWAQIVDELLSGKDS